jgi:hypothetical protein
MRKGAPHVTIDPEYLEIFDEVAKRMESRLFPRPTRSGLMNKAASLWVESVKVDRPDLRPVIDEIEQRYERLRSTEPSRTSRKVLPLERRGLAGGRRPSA